MGRARERSSVMHEHRNMPPGASHPEPCAPHLRCPHCGNDGIVAVDVEPSYCLPCPGCQYGARRAESWYVAPGATMPVPPSAYRGVTWENGVTLEHTRTCQAAADSRHYPDGHRCRRPARPVAGGSLPLCDFHAAGGVVPESETTVGLLRDARQEYERRQAAARERRGRELSA